jgi:hypothetical protein
MQPIKKKTLPNIAQKFPRLDIIKPIEEIKNKNQPIIFIILIFILPTNF